MYTINHKATTHTKKQKTRVIANKQTKERKQNKNIQLTQKKKRRATDRKIKM